MEHGDAAGVVSRESQSNDRIRFKGYRIGIFFDNGAEARANALAAKQTFRTAFPDIPVYLVYENPYFKVSAGNCVTSEEAIVLLGKIRSQFPEAYLMREDLTVADLIRLNFPKELKITKKFDRFYPNLYICRVKNL